MYHILCPLHRHNSQPDGPYCPQGIIRRRFFYERICWNAYVDPDLCIGCTQCAGLCPAVFQMEGTLAVAQPGPIPPEEVPQAVDAANACPVSAIRIEE